MSYSLLVLLAALILSLLFIQVQIGHTEDRADAQQSMARSQMGRATVSNRLMVYLTGDLALAGELREQLEPALRQKGLPFDEILFLEEIPEQTGDNPFLAIHLADRGFWTPIYASRTLKATMRSFVGRPVDRDLLFTPGVKTPTTVFSAETCAGECSEGERTLSLSTQAIGLVSLPFMRAHTAGKVAEQAAILVADGLPDHLNPAKWHDRAHELALERMGEEQGGISSSFQRLPGCMGGIVLVGRMGRDVPWSLMYYDAGGDAITEVLSRSDLALKFPGVAIGDQPGHGSGNHGWSLHLGGGRTLTIAPGTCSLSGIR